jgi:anti-anti-sigma factor
MRIAANQFSVTEIEVDGLAGVAVDGEINEATCGELEAALAGVSNGGGPAVLDLGGCTFMDSKGLDVIVRVATRLQDDGRQLAVYNARGPVRRLLRVTGATAWDGLLLHRDRTGGAAGPNPSP